METSVDLAGGTTYTVMGTSELMSVPYALYSKTAESVINDLVNDADSDTTNELNTGVLLNGTDLEITDAGGTIITDLSSLAGGGLGNWTLTDTNIVNNNTGNIGIGSPTPMHFVEVGSIDSNAVMAIGHMGGFNEAKSAELFFSEDLEYNNFCGIKFQLNGSSNNLHMIGGCSIEDTIARFNRNGEANFEQMRIGDQILTNPTSTLTVDGDIQVNGNVNITGNISKGSGTFKIDHPLDPENNT
jgi:hypothetical protein